MLKHLEKLRPAPETLLPEAHTMLWREDAVERTSDEAQSSAVHPPC